MYKSMDKYNNETSRYNKILQALSYLKAKYLFVALLKGFKQLKNLPMEAWWNSVDIIFKLP